MNKDFCYPDGKRYYTFDSFLKQKFGCKIAKISLNGGFTCPNRDGTKGVGGCIYCSDKLSGDFAGDPKTSIAEQLAYGKKLTSGKWKHVKSISSVSFFSLVTDNVLSNVTFRLSMSQSRYRPANITR